MRTFSSCAIARSRVAAISRVRCGWRRSASSRLSSTVNDGNRRLCCQLREMPSCARAAPSAGYRSARRSASPSRNQRGSATTPSDSKLRRSSPDSVPGSPGLPELLHSHYFLFVTPEQFEILYSAAMKPHEVVVGGIRTVWGPALRRPSCCNSPLPQAINFLKLPSSVTGPPRARPSCSPAWSSCSFSPEAAWPARGGPRCAARSFRTTMRPRHRRSEPKVICTQAIVQALRRRRRRRHRSDLHP